MDSPSKSYDYFPSAIPESLAYRSAMSESDVSSKPALNPLSQIRKTEGNKMTVILSIGSSREPVPMMKCESSDARDVAHINCELIMESKRIQTKFSNFILDVCSLFQSHPPAYIKKLQLWLSFQSCSQSAKTLEVFDGNSDTLKAKTIPALVTSLQSYTSWYNYTLIADIAGKFGGSEGDALVKAYEADLREYLKRLVHHCPPFSSTLQGTEELQVKVDRDLSTTTLSDIAIFKATLCKLCNLDPRFLVITKIDSTKFCMTWAFPKVATQHVLEAAKSNSSALAHNDIRSIRIADVDIMSRSNNNGTPPAATAMSAVNINSLSAQSQLKHCKSGNDVSHEAGESNPASTKSEKEKLIPDRSKDDRVTVECLTEPRTGAGTQSCTNLLSEIADKLKAPDLLSYESTATSSHPPKGAGKVTYENLKNNQPFHAKVTRFTGSISSQRKPVSFLWRLLGRANPTNNANIYVITIQDIPKVAIDDIQVRKGQYLKALYRVFDRVFTEASSRKQGFVPYSSCRVSWKHYGYQSAIAKLSYRHLYPECPDGIDLLPRGHSPEIKMVALEQHVPKSQEELQVNVGETFNTLYCDTDCVYASKGQHGGLLPRSVCALSQETAEIFKRWKEQDQRFRSDFVIKLNETRPSILNESPVSMPKSKVGKLFTIVQNFVPDSADSGSNFTIRKGLRVKVVKESGHLVCATTKTGASFWIPSGYVRPAKRKSSDANQFVTIRM